MKAKLLDAAPNGSLAVCHKSGWIQNESFVQWCRHILSNVKPTKDDPVILVLDGHYSHTRNVELLELSRVNGAHIVCLPPHCTHKMQLLGWDSCYLSKLTMLKQLNSGSNKMQAEYYKWLQKNWCVSLQPPYLQRLQEVSPNTHEASDHSSEPLPNRLDDANTSQPRPGSSSINEPKTPQNYPTDRGRESGSAALLKSSQYKNELADDFKRKLLTNKETYERKGVQKKQTDKVPTQRKRQKKQSQVSSDSEDEELDEPVYISTDN
ncbi:hypothetical protein ANN_21385 [Periplaneta americana]|uniref:DDE-1 domain-containing protein n=1 Tax=Periplaneta americana TaxID=6978 RepID=A0ABQ8SF49_PERAM|nr:hypothetical protein ANN_21385 [Periplaneta americana]